MKKFIPTFYRYGYHLDIFERNAIDNSTRQSTGPKLDLRTSQFVWEHWLEFGRTRINHGLVTESDKTLERVELQFV